MGYIEIKMALYNYQRLDDIVVVQYCRNHFLFIKNKFKKKRIERERETKRKGVKRDIPFFKINLK